MNSKNWFSVWTGTSFLATSIIFGQKYNETGQNTGLFIEILRALLSERLNVLILFNQAYNLLYLFGKLIQTLFFGSLKPEEVQNLKDFLLNHIMLKIIFVVAIIEAMENLILSEILMWTSWFSLIGFFKIFSFLCKERFNYLSTLRRTDGRILALLSIILISNVASFLFCIQVFYPTGYSILLLLTFECFTLFLETIQTFVKYGILLIDVNRPDGWENSGTYSYYIEFGTSSLVLVATLIHYAQILILHGFSFTFIDAVLFLQMRLDFWKLKDKINSYRNYRQLSENMNNLYPDATESELEECNDVCAFCREKMLSAKKLPCNHLFHKSCLQSWLMIHDTCPTCRFSLITGRPQETNLEPEENDEILPPFSQQQNQIPLNQQNFGPNINPFLQNPYQFLPNNPNMQYHLQFGHNFGPQIFPQNDFFGNYGHQNINPVQNPMPFQQNIPQQNIPQQNIPQQNTPQQNIPQNNEQKVEQEPVTSKNETLNINDNPQPLTDSGEIYQKYSDDFKSTSNERQKSLSERRQLMLEQQRAKYLEKLNKK